jgi:DNA repair and recombination protein RAD54B
LFVGIAFQSDFANPIERGSEANARKELQQLATEQKEELRRLTSSFVLGRPAEINCEFLPPKQDLVIFCPLSPLQVGVIWTVHLHPKILAAIFLLKSRNS